MDKKHPSRPFRSSEEELAQGEPADLSPQTESSAYRLAFADRDFLLREDLRPVRLQLELLKPDLLMMEHGVLSTVVIFGSARIPAPDSVTEQTPGNLRKLSHYYAEAQELARLASEASRGSGQQTLHIVTGGGPGIMEAANRGAADAEVESIGLNIVLPMEQAPNRYITPALSFRFHYFALRKMHFLMRARAIVVFPGGFGTLDELFDVLTLLQTGKIKPLPILVFGREFWQSVLNLEYLADQGMISHEDLDLIRYVDSASEAWEFIERYLATEISGA